MFWRKPRLVSKKYQESKRRKRRIIFIVTVLTLFILLIFVFWLGYSKTFRITNTEIKGLTALSEKDVRENIENTLNKNFLFVLPRDNTALLPKEVLKRNLKSAFTEIKEVKVSLLDQNSIEVEIEERKPIGVWCEELESTQTSTTTKENITTSKPCFLLDELGYIFGKAPSFSGNLFFKYYGGNNASTTIGSSYLPEETFRERVFFITSLKTLDLNPTAYTWGEDGDSSVELDPSGISGVRGSVVFNNDDSLSEVFERLSLTLTHEDFKDRDLTIIDMHYIDLRSKDKIFYKLKEE